MKLSALARAARSRPTLPEITGPLQVRSFQQDFVPRDPNAKSVKNKYPAFYDPHVPSPPASDKIVQLAERIAAPTPEKRRQLGPSLTERIRHPNFESISTEGMDWVSKPRDLQELRKRRKRQPLM